MLTPPPIRKPTPTPELVFKPALTPSPAERPMANLDGIAPFLTNGINPIPDIVETVETGVVGIINYVELDDDDEETQAIAQSGGSGFIFSSEGYILTNCHVIEGASSLGVTLSSGEEVSAELIGMDQATDIAVVKIDKSNLTPLKLGDSAQLRVGDFAIAVGNPLSEELERTVTFGIISSTNRSIYINGHTNDYLQTDAAINYGNSGGPLLNLNGEVIGINTAKNVYATIDEYGNPVSAEGLGFALPINNVKELLEPLITQGYLIRPGMGITVVTLYESEAAVYQLPMGVFVYSIVTDGPAYQAGLRAGDVILSYDDHPATEQEYMLDYLDAKSVGDTITFEVWRKSENKNLTFTVTLADKSTIDFDNVEYNDIF